MILLGLIVMLAGAGLGAATVLASRGAVEAVTLSVFGFTRETGPLELLAVGALSGFVTCLGLALVLGAIRGRARRRREEELEDRIDELEEIHEDELDRIREAVAEAKLKDADFARREKAMQERGARIEARERELGLRSGPPTTREHPTRPTESSPERPSASPAGAPPNPAHDRPSRGTYERPAPGAYEQGATGQYEQGAPGPYDHPAPGQYDRAAQGGYEAQTGAFDPGAGGEQSAWPEPAPPRQVQRRRRSGV
jgi:hypothetical protein